MTIRYSIVKTEDLSYSTCVRIQHRIVVEKLLSTRELSPICREIIEEQLPRCAVNALGFFFYLPGTDTDYVCTAGSADWAPYGNWAAADTVEAGDYARHALLVERPETPGGGHACGT